MALSISLRDPRSRGEKARDAFFFSLSCSFLRVKVTYSITGLEELSAWPVSDGGEGEKAEQSQALGRECVRPSRVARLLRPSS